MRSFGFGHIAMMFSLGGMFGRGMPIDQFLTDIFRTMPTQGPGRRSWRPLHSRYTPHQGEQEKARRRRQLAAGQIHFIKHGPV